MPKLRRLIWDLETSPNIGFFWRAGHKQFVNYDSILEERRIICVGYKWAGEKEVHALTWNGEQDDCELLRKFLKVANSADELVAHNGDKFDLPWLRTRCAFHKLSTFPRYKTIDTLQWARRNFMFNSNRLDYIASFLGFGSKIVTGLKLWKDVVHKNDRKALGDMVTYCKRDVELLEKVYDRLADHCSPKSHAGVVEGREKWSCPHCASERVRRLTSACTLAGVVQHRMICGRPHSKRSDKTNFGCGRTYVISHPVFKQFLKDKKKR